MAKKSVAPEKPPAAPEAKTPKALIKPAKRTPGERCELCGHWSPATEYGVDEKSGYCDRWEKLTSRDFWCEEFVSREKMKEMQDKLVEENEEYFDEET